MTASTDPVNVSAVTARATPEKRSEAIAIYRDVGLAEGERQTGIPKSTLRRWAREEGFNPAELAGVDAERTAAATVASQARMEGLRQELRERWLEEAALALDRLEQPYVEFRGKDAVAVTYEAGPPASAFKDFLFSAATALDKYRLEVGEVTGRTELVGVEPAEARAHLATVVEMAFERRAS